MDSLKTIVYNTIEVSRRSGVPVLFVSNPGLGKTTAIEKWCGHNGYALTTLIGGQRTAEEVLGYMINSNGRLITATPDWYNDIIEAEKSGKKSVLFVDELSTAAEAVQGALLQLIFSRRCGGGHKLPDSTLILSAANYKGNLPSACGIMAPTLNRFMIVNLSYKPQETGIFVDEFVYGLDSYTTGCSLSSKTLSPEEITRFKRAFRESFVKILKIYEPISGGSGLNIGEQDLDGIYEYSGDVYNFVSGRTVSYLERVLRAVIELGAENFTHNECFEKYILGLVGQGNLQDEIGESYRKEITAAMRALVEGGCAAGTHAWAEAAEKSTAEIIACYMSQVSAGVDAHELQKAERAVLASLDVMETKYIENIYNKEAALTAYEKIKLLIKANVSEPVRLRAAEIAAMYAMYCESLIAHNGMTIFPAGPCTFVEIIDGKNA
ncbi:MAG: ATP-binding protein, partial [Spirochaetaceae bacterium]|nr:ATP-binding protein [Spirochaetaceae bacterium]